MKRRTLSLQVFFSVCVLFLFVFPGITYAALLPYEFSGVVVGKDVENEVVRIETDSGTFDCDSPNEYALEGVEIGDRVSAAGLGSPENLVTLKKFKKDTDVITDIYGDPDYGSHELWGGYSIEHTDEPDCSACYGINCDAKNTSVTITDTDGHETSEILLPGQSYTYKDQVCRIDINFLWGQAPSYPYCTAEPWVGPQAVSNFVIHIRHLPPTKGITLTFDELCGPVHDLSYRGITFDFTLGSAPSSDATYGYLGWPGICSPVIHGRCLEGNTAGILTMAFDVPMRYVDFGLAFQTDFNATLGVSVELFDSMYSSIFGAVEFNTTQEGTCSVMSYQSPQLLCIGCFLDIKRVEIRFNSTIAPRFAIDNLSLWPTPECKSDFFADGDVDGKDLATFAWGAVPVSLEELAREFGRSNCLPNL